jgi:hypothetical protein
MSMTVAAPGPMLLMFMANTVRRRLEISPRRDPAFQLRKRPTDASRQPDSALIDCLHHAIEHDLSRRADATASARLE